ncbi:MAG: hypothetical protein RSE93_04785 [Oscillospiraceae bacterium]
MDILKDKIFWLFTIIYIIGTFRDYKGTNRKFHLHNILLNNIAFVANILFIVGFGLYDNIPFERLSFWGIVLYGLALFSPYLLFTTYISFKFKIDKWIYGDKLTMTKQEINDKKEEEPLQRGYLD